MIGSIFVLSLSAFPSPTQETLERLLSLEFNKRTNTFDNCPPEGQVRVPNEERRELLMEKNKLKNRYKSPRLISGEVTLRMLIGTGEDIDRWSESGAVSIVGVVNDVRSGGPETCNCQNGDKLHEDTHIEIVPARRDLSNPKRVFVVEVTSRVRYIKAKQGVDWTSKELESLAGKKVRITGWLFYDGEHEDQSFTYDPDNVNGKANNRATVWEVHPVTEIEILR